MRWWCAAQETPWSWSWQPYPGVWVFVALLAVVYLRLRRGGAEPSARWTVPPDRRTAAYAAGLALLWVALDWPVGALGAGYLASVHMVQFLLIGLVAPPLLLYGLPPRALAGLLGRRTLGGALRLLTRPLTAIVLFNAVLVATHWPSAVDGLMASQLGSFVIDTAWLGAGLLFWWPVVCPLPARPRFPDPLKVGYLLFAMIVGTAPYAFLTFAELPFYAVYELAPPVAGITSRMDQQLAGIVMKVGGGAILWTAIGVLFWRWYRSESEPAPAGKAGASGG